MQNVQIQPRPPAPQIPARKSGLLEGPLGWLVSAILILALFAAILLMPPINLLDRLQAFDVTRIGTEGGAVRDPDGTMLNFPAEGVRVSFGASIDSIPRADFIEGRGGNDIYNAARNLPTYLIPKSPYYTTRISGGQPESVVLTLPIPNDSLPYETLGLYMWNGAEWAHVPSTVLPAEDIVEARLSSVPATFMVMQTVPSIPEAAASLEFGQQVPEGAVVAQEIVAGLQLRGDGALDGNAPVNTGRTIPVIRNWTGDPSAPSVRTDLVNNMLIDAGQKDNQLIAVEQTITANGYPGVVIDYRGIDGVPSARADFVHLISLLSERLHAAGKTIAIRVESPSQLSAEAWDTKGHDWRALGSLVDSVIVPGPVDPRAYQANGEVETLLRFASGEIDPRKIQFELPAQSVERSGNYLILKGYQQSLQPLLREIQSTDNGSDLTVTLDNERLLTRVTWDEALGTYFYSYQDDQNLERTVFIESASSVAQKLQMLGKYNIRKVALQIPASSDIDPNIWNVVFQFQQGGDLSSTSGKLDVFFAIRDSEGTIVAQEVRPIDNPSMTLAAAGSNLQVEATIINNNGQAVTAPQSSQLLAFAGTSIAAAASSASAAASDNSAEAAAAPAASEETVRAASVPDGAFATTNTIVNVREGPGTVYNILGQVTQGNNYKISAKNEAGDWYQIEYAGGQTGWVINSLISANGDLGTVAATSDYPEAPQVVAAPVAAAPADGGGAPAAPPAPVSAPIAGGGPGFGYGVQAHMVHNDQAGQVMGKTTGMGFNWVKQQIEWKVFESSPGGIDFGSSDGIVNAANGAGVSLLFSVVNAPAWAREPGFDGSVGGPPQDPQTYANFVGAMAGKYCGSSVKAIEVWNEQNLHYEWGNKPLNPGEYVALLAPAYNAIKSACPSMTVVSGALTPAGNNGNLAMDDFAYLEAMFQAGVANYSDAIGAHPSGYNVPPSHTWETACDAIQVSGNSFNGACDSPHHSWSFRSTMLGYRNIADTYGANHLRIWPTEFGWAAGGAFNPNYAYANDNDFGEQAAWTVEAYQMMKQWGWVGPAFLWNLNFRVVADGTEKAQWGILDNGWGPLPVYNALQAMPK